MAFRPTRLEMEKRLDALTTIVAEINPCSVRQVFYQAVVRGVVGKTEAEYDKVQRALVRLRRRQIIPYGWIADGTRWRIKPTTFSSLEQAFERAARLYRRALWDEADVYMEIWLEKDALSGVVTRSPTNTTSACTSRAAFPRCRFSQRALKTSSSSASRHSSITSATTTLPAATPAKRSNEHCASWRRTPRSISSGSQ